MIHKLGAIQLTLHAPKSQYNSFGKYSYRSCEDILEALKEPLRKNGASVVLTDSIEMIGSRVYVKAEATLYDSESGEKISACAYAREDETKKGMDGAQITGAASSYARKYALNGLFLIDDNKDSDTRAPDPPPDRSPREQRPVCADCGGVIADVTAEDGRRYSAAEIHDNTWKRFGAPLCWACAANRRRQQDA